MNGWGDQPTEIEPDGSAPTEITPAADTVRLSHRDDDAAYTEVFTERRPIDTAPATVALPRDGGTRFDLMAGAPAQRADSTRYATAAPIRIGPGIVPEAVPAPRRRRRWWGRLTRILSAVVTLVLVGGAAWTLWQWWQRSHNNVAVTSVAVAPAQQLAGKCDVQYDIVGTVMTNGKAGTISYEWVRSDGQSSGVLKQSVAAGETSTKVHLYWRFSGQGSMTAQATLHVLAPARIEGAAQFPYSCQ